MKWLKKLFNFYINASIHVALAVYCLIWITELYCNVSQGKTVNYFAFFATITAYNFIKYVDIGKLRPKNLKNIHFFSLICSLLLIYFGFQLKTKTLLFFVPFGLLTFFYAFPLDGYFKNLRNIPSLKIVIIALIWSGTTVLAPIFDAGLPFNQKIILMFIQRFLFVIALTLPFDIRDFRFDKKHLQTIPQLIGVERTKKLGFILLTITLIIEFFITPNQNFKTAFIIIWIILLLFLQRSSIHQKKYYASFWVEAIPVFWFALLLVVSKSAI